MYLYFIPLQLNIVFHHILPKSTTFAPGSQTRMYGIFGPGMVKNSIRNTGIKRATPEHMFATLAFGSGDNLHCDLGHSLLLLPRCVIYYFKINRNTNYNVYGQK